MHDALSLKQHATIQQANLTDNDGGLEWEIEAIKMMKSRKKQEIMQKGDQSLGVLLSMGPIFGLGNSWEFAVYGQDQGLEKHRAPNTYVF